MSMSEPITEDLLRANGFKWEQGDRQPTKHWLLWLGRACLIPDGANVFQGDSGDLGIELAFSALDGPFCYCWIRSDFAGRYSRLLHVRRMTRWDEVTTLISALTGRPWNRGDVLYGQLWSPEDAQRLRAESERLDRRIAAERDAHLDRLNGADPDRAGVMKP